MKKTTVIIDEYYYPSETSKETIKEHGLEWLLQPGQMVEDPAVPDKTLKFLGWMDEYVFDLLAEPKKTHTAIFYVMDSKTGKKEGTTGFTVGHPDLKKLKPVIKN